MFRLIISAALLLGIVLVTLYRDRIDISTIEQYIEQAGLAGVLVFMLIYIVGTVLFFPGSILTLTGGALFGPVLGTLYSLTSATIGATLAFLVSRYVASDWVEQKSKGQLKRLINGVENEGWRFIAFVRLVPLFPFNLLNYALGLTRINLFQYIIASYICMLPGAIAYTYLGHVGRQAIAGDEALIQKILLAIALLAAVAFLPRLIKMIYSGPMMSVQDLKQKLDNNDDVVIVDVRKPDEFIGEQGHIAGAKNIALHEFAERTNELSDFTDKTIVLVCRTDKRSASASRILADIGFTDVFVATGGMTNWIKAGYNIEH